MSGIQINSVTFMLILTLIGPTGYSWINYSPVLMNINEKKVLLRNVKKLCGSHAHAHVHARTHAALQANSTLVHQLASTVGVRRGEKF